MSIPVIIIGVIVMTWSWWLFQKNKTDVSLTGNPSFFVVNGPYRFSRNPMYLGILMILTGIGISFSTIPLLIVPILFFITVSLYHIPIEEMKMARIFKSLYIGYKKRVWRWISIPKRKLIVNQYQSQSEVENTKQWAIITGATEGIGLEMANLLALEGYNLVLISRNLDKLKEVQQDIQKKYEIQVIIIAKDLSKPDSPQEIFSELQREDIFIEILVNNAGIGTYGSFHELDLHKELAMIQINITSLVYLCHLFLKPMIERNTGWILNVASTAGFQAGAMMSNYFATKGYVILLSEGLSIELNHTNISVTCLCPGPTKTQFFTSAGMGDKKIANKDRFYIMESKIVAKKGIDGMIVGKTLVIPGLINRLLYYSERLVPRSITTRVTAWLISKA